MPAAKRHDFGTLAMRAVAPTPAAGSVVGCLPRDEHPAKTVFAARVDTPATARPVAAVWQAFTQAPDERRTVNLVLA